MDGIHEEKLLHVAVLLEHRRGEGDDTVSRAFLEEFAQQIKNTVPATMLNKNICKAYGDGVRTLQSAPEITVIAKASQETEPGQFKAQPVAHLVRAQDFLAKKEQWPAKHDNGGRHPRAGATAWFGGHQSLRGECGLVGLASGRSLGKPPVGQGAVILP